MLPLETRPDGELVDAPLVGPDDPGRLLAHLDAVRCEAPGERARWFDKDAVTFLTGGYGQAAGPIRGARWRHP